MSTLSASPADSSGTPVTASRRVVDAPTRMVHWLMALSFTGAYITAETERWHLLHITLGYTLLGLIAWRLVWGLLGPRRSRLGALFSRLGQAPALARAWLNGQGNLLASQQWLNALAIVAILVLGLVVTVSGFGLEQDWLGDLLEELHEGSGEAMLAVVLAHLGLIALAAVLKRQNTVLPMITGRMPGRGPDLVKQSMGWLAALILAAVVGFWIWQWQSAPTDTGPLDGRPAISRNQNRGHDDD
ncbi:MAG: cytochrome b [Methylibium sp.]|nr:cytochrome b [Methylibium sp.]